MGKADATPMMRQYRAAKQAHPDKMLFFRMGDFYEMFYEDAKEAARILGIALTSRNKGPDAIPMAGVPVKSAKQYLKRLLEAGKRVAICEQVEDPATAKGLVDRQVVRVVTPGTMIDEEVLDERSNLYLLAVAPCRRGAGLAWVDLSTGEFWIHEVSEDRPVEAEIDRVGPAECLVPEEVLRAGTTRIVQLLKERTPALTPYPDWHFTPEAGERVLKEHFGVATLEGFGIESIGPGVGAAGALLSYLKETQKQNLEHIRAVRVYQPERYLRLDDRARRALEILRNARGGTEGTLFAHLDRTCTAMGARLLKAWLLTPLGEKHAIEERLDAVESLVSKTALRQELRGILREVSDLERLSARLALGTAHARDLVALARSLRIIPQVKKLLAEESASLIRRSLESLGDFSELCGRIEKTLVENPPLAITEGGLIRDGVSEELDELRRLTREGGAWLQEYQRREAERTGIPTLKVGYNRVFGYYLEVTNAHAEKVPADYVRKQTLKNAERYITPELKEYETRVLTAGDRAKELEYQIFTELRLDASRSIQTIQEAASALACLDVLASLAHVAVLHDYVRPVMTEEKVLRIREGRHPVLEVAMGDEVFVPNDTVLEPDHPIAIITGPNMAGKSTYIRQTALIVLLAHAGSFVPAREAEIGLVDRLFARVGAADDLYHGQSTFMIEMVETATIVHNATERSLIILDEVGRGTSTFDGISIAWAVTEYLYEKLKVRTLFATHYHELTELSLLHPGIRNLNVAVKEYKNEIVFLRKIVEGAADKSYGIHVAHLASLPESILERAREILSNLERQAVDGNDLPSFAPPKEKPAYIQLDLFANKRQELLARLARMDLNKITPLEALNFLAELKDALPTS